MCTGSPFSIMGAVVRDGLSMGVTNFILQVRGPQKVKVRCVRVLNSAVLYVIRTKKCTLFLLMI